MINIIIYFNTYYEKMANDTVNDIGFTTAFYDPSMGQLYYRFENGYVSNGPPLDINKVLSYVKYHNKDILMRNSNIKTYWCESHCYHTFSHSGLVALIICNQHFEEENSLIGNEAGYSLLTELMEFLVTE